ncbi:MAG: fumarylacetoacetate hydrolase family protein [Chloroflexota bacterium]|nr:fumarylacetoacetate hydrolase family protein [Chloroflexota bacterium]MEC9451766.1 fumarylacetoacetate hydrolase family protein [Chloroflexota bacterium]
MKYFRKQNSIINDEWYSSLIAFDEKSYYELGLDDFRELYLMAKELNISPDQYVNKLISDNKLSVFDGDIDESLMLSPIFPQEVWAAGVTYSDSMRERQAESDTPDVYAKVYSADRPEIFFKGTGERMQGPDEELGIREDSGWDVPESELAVVIIDGEIAGYTIGNDMSSRSIEGENPLYLPQAKVYNKSFSLGPCIVSAQQIGDPQNLKVDLIINRKGDNVFQGESSTSQMKRNVFELTEWLQKSNDLPPVAVLMTGTGIIPPQDFTLQEGDVVSISIEKIGTLTNKIVIV